jgi:hypothetical protein
MKIDNGSRYKPYPRYKDSGVEWPGKFLLRMCSVFAEKAALSLIS